MLSENCSCLVRGLHVDRLLRAIMQQEGCSNRAAWSNMNAAFCPTPEKGDTSVTRETCGDRIGEEYKCPWQTLSEHGAEEYLLELDHSDWHDTLRICGIRGVQLENDCSHADILVFHDQSITVRWLDGTRKTFVKTDEGMYRLEEKV